MPAVFFISLMILGNYMLLNLFLAILLKFISENSDHEKQHEGEENCQDDDENGEHNKSSMKDDKKDLSESKNANVNIDGQDVNGSQMNSSNSNIEEEFE